MDKRYYQKHVFSLSLLITILIFAVGIITSYYLDFFRVDAVDNSILKHEINRDSYLIQKDFLDTFGQESCDSLNSQIYQMRREMVFVGNDLTSYGTNAMFRKDDFDYLKRKYFLLELDFLNLVKKANERCNNEYEIIVFFYTIDDKISERQGFIIEDLNEQFDHKIIVLSFDKDYDDDAALNLLKYKFNITIGPTLLVNGYKMEGLKYTGEIKAIIDQQKSSAKGINSTASEPSSKE